MESPTKSKRKRKKNNSSSSNQTNNSSDSINDDSNQDQSPTPQKSNKTKTVHSKQNGKKKDVTSSQPTTTTYASTNKTSTSSSSSSNPYIQILDKKLRNLNKKLRKANESYEKKTSGGNITKQQELQLEKRASLQAQFDEYTAIKDAFIGFAAEEQRIEEAKFSEKKSKEETELSNAKVTPTKNNKSKKKKSIQQSKKEVKDVKTTKILTAGTTFDESNVVINNIVKCLFVANLVRNFEDEKCQRVVQCVDILCGSKGSGSGSSKGSNDGSDQSIKQLLAIAKLHAQTFTLSGSDTEAKRVLCAVDVALDDIQQEELQQEKIAQAKSVLDTEGSAFNFFVADEEKVISNNEIAARAIRRILE
jgi:hypothetical protein